MIHFLLRVNNIQLPLHCVIQDFVIFQFLKTAENLNRKKSCIEYSSVTFIISRVSRASFCESVIV